ncbi:MAG TPA: 4-hydroxy-3-methylbut-2-enyl diphosphate reductase, partial [Cyclobacteriaceae bacterium]|nr:4-hydroxy-3-methylbut-2-enyl diphosphate reductase [Cyclobacteriaceae bacterium]
SVIVRDMEEAQRLAKYITDSKSKEEFYQEFAGRYSKDFDPEKDLQRVGVVNQTTMLATETQAIADYFKQAMMTRYGVETLKEHFADTRDTLCYATNDNQDATYRLLETDADLAIVVGGYNSSNTSHIVELCERKFPTYFINSDTEIKSQDEIHHFDYPKKEKRVTMNYLPEKNPVKIILTSGASCPDTLVDRVMLKLLGYFSGSKPVENVLVEFEKA